MAVQTNGCEWRGNLQTIGRTATMVTNLPAHCGGSSIQTSGYLPREIVLSLSERECQP